jgi:hypothetical protein
MTDNEVLFKPIEVEQRFKIKRGTLANWRSSKKGPPYLKVGGRIYYPVSGLIDWFKAHKVISDS